MYNLLMLALCLKSVDVFAVVSYPTALLASKGMSYLRSKYNRRCQKDSSCYI